ncbi:hypothetical protein pb186bvf_019088 [Paramecium bursaria]
MEQLKYNLRDQVQLDSLSGQKKNRQNIVCLALKHHRQEKKNEDNFGMVIKKYEQRFFQVNQRNQSIYNQNQQMYMSKIWNQKFTRQPDMQVRIFYLIQELTKRFHIKYMASRILQLITIII